jgi:hypothetical protein
MEPIGDLENRSNWRLLKSGPYKPQLDRLFCLIIAKKTEGWGGGGH